MFSLIKEEAGLDDLKVPSIFMGLNEYISLISGEDGC